MSLITYNNYQAEPGLLAKRETRYFLGFVQGLSDKEVARDCGVSPNTVTGARKRILYKLNACRMTQAVAEAFTRGMVKRLSLILVMSTLISMAGLGVDQEPIHRRGPRTTTTSRIRHREEYHVAA